MKRYTMFIDWRLNIVKISILPKLIYEFNTVSIKIPARLVSIEKITLKSNEKAKDIE